MIKLVYCLRKLPHLTREGFQRHWRNIHGPLVRKHAAVLKIQHYSQVHTKDSAFNESMRAIRGAPEPYDGVAELLWKNHEEMAAAFTSPEGQKAAAELLEDERLFIDHSKSPIWTAEEHPFIDAA